MYTLKEQHQGFKVGSSATWLSAICCLICLFFNAPVKTRHSLAPVWSLVPVLSLQRAPLHCSLCSMNCPVVCRRQKNRDLGMNPLFALLDRSCQKPPRFNSTEIRVVILGIIWGPFETIALLTTSEIVLLVFLSPRSCGCLSRSSVSAGKGEAPSVSYSIFFCPLKC